MSPAETNAETYEKDYQRRLDQIADIYGNAVKKLFIGPITFVDCVLISPSNFVKKELLEDNKKKNAMKNVTITK